MRILRVGSIAAIVVALALALAAPLAAQQEPFPGYDAYVTTAMKAWAVPGVAIAIVRNDTVIYAHGYGVREIGKPGAVDAQTMFAIGSSSKAFTAAAIGMLIDEGKLRFDDPVTQHLPGFEMYDPFVTRDLTVRDILSHRSGLARGDLMWYGTDNSRDEILRRVRFLKPSSSFRSQFGYQNLMFLAAGQIVAAVSHKTWDDFVRERIFVPLGMSSTNTSVARLARLANVAQPHSKIDDTLRAIPYRRIDNIGPAGSINSTATDMAQWLRFQLAGGKFGGKQLLSTSVLAEEHTSQTIIPLAPLNRLLNPYAHFSTYGMGWFLEDYRGKEVRHHGGAIDGMSALVAMLPEEHLGVVILTNMNGSLLPNALMFKTFDLQLHSPPRDWSAEMKKVFDGALAAAKAAQQKMEAPRVAGTKPSLALEQYAGTYTDSMYGDLKVRVQNGALYATMGPPFEGPLEHWHYDTFRATWKDRMLGKSIISFALNAAGKADLARIDLGGSGVLEFKRAPPQADTTAARR